MDKLDRGVRKRSEEGRRLASEAGRHKEELVDWDYDMNANANKQFLVLPSILHPP